jgi:hypothetical protein
VVRCASQEGCRVSSSSLRRDFCSGIRLASNFALSNFTGPGSGAEVVLPLVLVRGVPLAADDLGAPKKEVRVASFFGFLRSAADRASALRFVDIGNEVEGL